MTLDDLLKKKRSSLLSRWLDRIIETYPADTKKFFENQKDQFANPVGYTISREIAKLFDELLQAINPDRVTQILDGIIKIRAIQDYSPSQALAFIFQLKDVIREDLETEVKEHELWEELLQLESKVDKVALFAFDNFMGCREKIYEMRVHETNNQVSGLLKRANLISEIPEWESNLKKNRNL